MSAYSIVRFGIAILISAFAATFNVSADTPPGSTVEIRLPTASPPPACVCTKTNEGNFVIANCQCGATQCVAIVSADGKVSNSITCVK